MKPEDFVPYPELGSIYKFDFPDVLRDIRKAEKADDMDLVRKIVRTVALNDLFFYIYFVMGRVDIHHPFLVKRCYEVQAKNTNTADVWAREHYKAVDLKEPVPTPGGFKEHGDLKAGDEVFGGDGEIKKVLARSEVFQDAECYEVEFDDGYKVTVSGEHLWEVERRSRKRIPGTEKRINRERVVLRTEEMFKSSHRPDNRLAVEIKPALYEEKELLIHPYVLGVWLGDGHTGDARISVGSEDSKELTENLSQHIKAELTGRLIRVGNGVRGYRNSSEFKNYLREYGIFKNKGIPPVYLHSSYEQRMELLRGLMDTDGHCDKRGTATFVNINKSLCDSVFQLLGSLGLKPRYRENISTVNGEDYTFYQISFQAYKNVAPFKLKRKLDRCKDGTKPKYRFIIDITKMPTIPVSCILVEGGTYLIGKNYVKTHNTTIITYGQNFFDITKKPETSVCLYSYEKTISKAMLRKIKHEFIVNQRYHRYFPEVFFEDPEKESPLYSIIDGLILTKRDDSYSEATFEAWGLDTQPTSKHFDVLDYDDPITLQSVQTPERIYMTEEYWKTSLSTGKRGGKRRITATRYSHNDLISYIKTLSGWETREYPVRDEYGVPMFLTEEEIQEKYEEYGPKVFAMQMELKPERATDKGFDIAWIKKYDTLPSSRLTEILLCDPGKKTLQHNDPTVILYLKFDFFRNCYLVDGVRGRYTQSGRWKKVLEMKMRYPNARFYYEDYTATDIQYFEEKMQEEGTYFKIHQLDGNEGNRKFNSIMRLGDRFEEGRVYLPYYLLYEDDLGNRRDLVSDFMDEFQKYPYPRHDDILDTMARITDPKVEIIYPTTPPHQMMDRYIEQPDPLKLKKPKRVEIPYTIL